MPDLSPNLELPYLLPSQAQKHVTHNEALERLDLLAQLTVQRFDAETPPAAPPGGRIWALGSAPTGDWAGQGGRLATFMGGAWAFLDPREGWRAWGLAESALRVWRGTAWEPMPLDELAGLGIGTSHDGTNRLAVVSPATLFSHAGSDHRLKINKAAAGDTAALLFQTGWAGRAELGLTGNDDFSLKVSADGGTWSEALKVSRGSGAADLAAGLKIGGRAAYHRGNILGPVAQAAGQPAGAVIERGANANGEYVRFADGTQICVTTAQVVDLTTAMDALYTTAAIQQVALPAAFVSTATMVAMVCGTNTENAWGVARTITTTMLNWRAWRTSAVPGQQFRLMAIGRWF